MDVRLYAPESYRRALTWDKRRICNGCGRAGWKGRLVPNKIFGVDISEACNIHDWMYHFGKTEEDRQEADRVFLNNIIRIINAHGGWLAWLRRYRAVTYYNAVVSFGGPAFWDSKNPNGTMMSVAVD